MTESKMLSEKLKLYLVPGFSGMIHDQIPQYINTVPFSEIGIKQWCDVVQLDQAEMVHLGQIDVTEPHPAKIKEYPVLKIVDLEGDYTPDTFRDECAGCIRVCCGAPMEWKEQIVFPRPTMSFNLVHAAHTRLESFPSAINHQFGFIGKTDKKGIRQRLVSACSGLPANVGLVTKWNGKTPMGDPAQAVFENYMLESSLALCPQGEGVATSRFYEACFYGRCPVVIGKTLVLGEDWHDLSFRLQLDASLDAEAMHAELMSIAAMSFEEAIERGRAAKNYFEQVVRPYFADPTLSFLIWMERKALRNK